MSSKALLSVIPKAILSPFPVVLHMDCTLVPNTHYRDNWCLPTVSSVISEHYFTPYPGDVWDGVTQLQPARPACATTCHLPPWLWDDWLWPRRKVRKFVYLPVCIIVYTSNSLKPCFVNCLCNCLQVCPPNSLSRCEDSDVLLPCG